MITPKPKKPYLGRAVENGKIRFFSVSSLTSADPRQYGGCLRRWHLRYIGMHKGEEFQAQKTGTQVHDEIRHYLTTGEDVLGRIARAAKPFIPQRGPDLRVEHDISLYHKLPGGDVLLESVLTAAGIPVIGDIDLVHTRGQYINPLGELVDDEPGTGEVIDWKSTGRMDNAKSGAELLETIQMVGYGEWLARDLPTLEHVRLSHVYIGTKGTPDACKATVRVPREEIATRWEQTESLARTIVDIAREPDSSKVDPNPTACSAYQGCPYANNQCRITQTQSLEGILGRAMARRLNHQTTDLLTITTTQEAPTLSLLDLIPAGTPGTSLNLPTLPANNPMAAALAALQAQESAPLAPPPADPVRQAFEGAVKHIKSSGMGMPPLTSEAASVYCVSVGILPVADQPGSGKLSGLAKPCETMSQVIELAVALGYAPTTNLTMGGGKAPEALPALVQPGAPVPSLEKGDAAAPLAGYVPPSEGEEGEKRGRGRPKGSGKKVTAPSAPVAATPPAPVENPVVADTANTPRTGAGVQGVDRLEIYVDSIPFTPFSYLDAYVEGVTSAIAQAYQVPDIRAVSVKDNPLSFGGWRAVLGAYVRENPPSPGIYVADTANGHREPVLVVADALRSLCTGGARGIR